MRVFTLLFMVFAVPAAAVTSSDAAQLTTLVTAQASKDARLDVLSAADVRKTLDTEAERTLAGCDTSACMSEIAAALDARNVLHGTVGHLDGGLVLSLSLLDTATGTALGRSVMLSGSVAGLARKLDDGVKELLVRVPTQDTKVRVLVLDIEVVGPQHSESGAPWLLISGGVVAGLGAVGTATAIVSEVVMQNAADKLLAKDTTRAADVPAIEQERSAAQVTGQIAWIAGAALVVGGVALVAAHFVVGE